MMSATNRPSLQDQSTDEGRTHLVVQIKTSARVARQIEAILRETGSVVEECSESPPDEPIIAARRSQ
jgi:chaperonin cofactor prefoldin